MKTSLSTFPYYKYPLTEAIKRTAAFGYEAIEIWGGRPHGYCFDMTPQRIKETQQVLDDSGIGISNYIPAQFRYPTNLSGSDEDIRKASVDYIKRTIDVAEELKSPYVSLCPGYSMYKQSPKQAWDAMIKSLTELIDHAKGMSLTLVLEPANRYETDLVVTIEDGIRVLEQLDYQIGLLPDTGHLFINRESTSDVVAKMEGIVAHYHIDDNMGVADEHMIPGDGKMNYDTFLLNLMKSGYQGYLTVELGFQYTWDPDPAVKKSRQFILQKVEELKKEL
jgi:fructoselysine 3-epimerase